MEPNSAYADKLRKARPDEEVLQLAISREAEEISFYEIPDTGLSTGEEEIAREHEAHGFAVRRVSKPSRPLSAVLDAYADREIHWLKVDVEGMEDSVVDSWHPSPARPWIVVIESTKPNDPQLTHMSWEHKLLEIGYKFCYFDGLNRFYLSVDHIELIDNFGPGPNYFDDFTLNGTATAPFCEKVQADAEATRLQLRHEESARIALEASLAQEQAFRTRLETQLVQEQTAKSALENNLTAVNSALERQLAAIEASTSWRITAPLRGFKRAISMAGHLGVFLQGVSAWVTLKPGSRPRRAVRRSLIGLASYVRARPRIANIARRLLLRYPKLQDRLQLVVHYEAPRCGGVRRWVDQTAWPPTDRLDLNSEPNGVRHVYRRVMQARRKSG